VDTENEANERGQGSYGSGSDEEEIVASETTADQDYYEEDEELEDDKEEKPEDGLEEFTGDGGSDEYVDYEEGSGDGQGFNRGTPQLKEEELDMVADATLEILREILTYFDAGDANIDEYEGDEQELIFDIVGDNLAILIGRHGSTLDALQYLISMLVAKRIGFRYPIVVDVEGYVHRRKQKLISLAKSAAARAIRQNRDVRLRPMNPYERRIIHMSLKDDKRISTLSEGQEPNRQVVITVSRHTAPKY